MEGRRVGSGSWRRRFEEQGHGKPKFRSFRRCCMATVVADLLVSESLMMERLMRFGTDAYAFCPLQHLAAAGLLSKLTKDDVVPGLEASSFQRQAQIFCLPARAGRYGYGQCFFKASLEALGDVCAFAKR